MELAQLEAFVQVAHHRSFSRAADALFLTQPSVTARIQSLERELGERLFERTGRSVTLTDAGHAFMPHAKRALTSVQEGNDAIDAVRHGEVGTIRIGASASIATYVLPTVLKKFRQTRPRVHISMKTGTSEDIIEHLLSGEVNVGICRVTQHPEIESRPLFNDDLGLVVPANHPFAVRGHVTIADAGREPFLFFERSSNYHGLIYSMFLRAGVVPEAVMELDSMETTKHMIEEGLGIAILPRAQVQRDVDAGVLRVIELDGMEQPARREMGVHVLRNRVQAPPIRDFLGMLYAEFGVEQQAVPV